LVGLRAGERAVLRVREVERCRSKGEPKWEFIFGEFEIVGKSQSLQRQRMNVGNCGAVQSTSSGSQSANPNASVGETEAEREYREATLIPRRKVREAFRWHETEEELRAKEDKLELQIASDQYQYNVSLEQAIVEEQEQREVVNKAVLELERRGKKRELCETLLEGSNKNCAVFRQQIRVRRKNVLQLIKNEEELQRITKEHIEVVNKFDSGSEAETTPDLKKRQI